MNDKIEKGFGTAGKSIKKGGLVRAGELLPEILPASLFDEVIRPDDIGYTHPVFLQCFMPTRHSDKNRDRWQTDCGRVSLVIRAGELANPAKPHEFKKCAVPAGPKARFVVAYINDYILREKLADCSPWRNHARRNGPHEHSYRCGRTGKS